MDQADELILEDLKFGGTSRAKNSNNTHSLNKPNQKFHNTSASATINHQTTSIKSKKAKKLPWNTDVLRDRFTPQPYQVQLVDVFMNATNLIVFINNEEYKNYLKIMCIRQHGMRVSSPNDDKLIKQRKLLLLITNMGSDISKYVELLSLHTNLKIAGIDFQISKTAGTNFSLASTACNENASSSEKYCVQLKTEAQILIMSISSTIDWFKRSLLRLDEIALIMFDEVGAAIHNQAYKELIDTYFLDSVNSNSSDQDRLSIIGFGSLSITRATSHLNLQQHIDYLKSIFRCENVETATDLLDTQNILNGSEPFECIKVCNSSSVLGDKHSAQSNSTIPMPEFASYLSSLNEFNSKLVKLVKDSYKFLEDMNESCKSSVSLPPFSQHHPHNGSASIGSHSDNLAYVYLLCSSVLNECLYLLNEVGIWCLTKSLLPFICQLDKLANYLEKQQQQQPLNVDSQLKDIDNKTLLSPTLQQQLIIQYTATCLRQIREMCIRRFIEFKSHTHHYHQNIHQHSKTFGSNHSRNYNSQFKSAHSSRSSSSSTGCSVIDSFLDNFATPKVKALVNLLKEYNGSAEIFSGLLFVHNKQVASSLSLLLKKLAKEEPSLHYLYPNYVIGSGTVANGSSAASTTMGSSLGASKGSSQIYLNETSDNSEFANNSGAGGRGLYATNNSGSSTDNDCLKQEEIIRKFYSGEINLLICTYEMEKSISSPTCVNLIMRFNCSDLSDVCASGSSSTWSTSNETSSQSGSGLFDYFSLIGTKSRAHNRNARCYFFVDECSFDPFLTQFVKCKQIEKTLANNYSVIMRSNRSILDLSRLSLNSHRTPKRVDLAACVEIINRYCVRLPSDALTQLAPYCVQKSAKINADQELHKCIFYLPINSGIRESIESNWELDASVAKQSVAYKACLILFTRNELNESFEPITKEMFYRQYMLQQQQNDLINMIDEKDWPKHQSNYAKLSSGAALLSYMAHRPGGNKRKQVYAKKQSAYLKSMQLITTQHQCYLYMFKCTLTTPINNSERETNAEKTTTRLWSFGLLTSRMLLEIVDFPIFTQNGEETVQMELIKSGIYLTLNQLKLIKSFHRFLFSCVLRMEGRGALASPHLLNTASTIGKVKNAFDQYGPYVCILTASKRQNESELVYDFDWDLMKATETCSDGALMKAPAHVNYMTDYETVEEAQAAVAAKVNSGSSFQFDEAKYTDSVVIPFYRMNDMQPQFYCVVSIERDSTPLSSFPSSSRNGLSNYSTFYQYFALKYGILIGNLSQPLLVVSHPSTRLNLLTPRYMNMKACVLQKSHHHHHHVQTLTLNASNLTSNQKLSSSSRIFLVPELVNLHPLTATVWKRSLCLPSILHRINSLLNAEELRREIAQSTGVGVPWNEGRNEFDSLRFIWDTRKEIEMSTVPDVEIDLATMQHQNEQQSASGSRGFSGLEQTQQQAGAGCSTQWDFEISEWDDSCIKELNKQKKTNNNTANNNLIELMSIQSNKTESTGWSDDKSTHKTLFIDINDMELFADDYDSELDEEYAENSKDKLKTKFQNDKSNQIAFKNYNSSGEEADEQEEYNDEYEEEHEQLANIRNSKDNLDDISIQNTKFAIDMDTLKADMKKKSAKLFSKLSIDTNKLSLMKSLVKLDKESNRQADCNELAIDMNALKNSLGNSLNINDLKVMKAISMNDESKSNNNNQVIDKMTKVYNKKSQLVDIIENVDLREYLTNVDFQLENNCSNECVLNLLDLIKQKLSLKSQKNDESVEEAEKTKTNFEKKYEFIELPVKKDKVDELLIKYEKLENNEISSSNGLLRSNTKVKLIELKTSGMKYITGSDLLLRNTDWTFDFSLDDNDCNSDIDLSSLPGPSPALLLQALTLSNAADGFDLERLETVGDSFLKQAITVYLFFSHPNVHEGKLSYLRSKEVSNFNLYRLGKRRGLHELLISSKFEPLDSWLPPHYESVLEVQKHMSSNTSAPTKSSQSATTSSSSLSSKQAKSSNTVAETQIFDKYKDHLVSDKSIADSVEAIIGAYLITSGPKAALKVMSWFGLRVLPKAKCEDGSEVLIDMPQVPAVKINDPLKLKQLLEGYSSFEACIGYKFKQPAYLLQAFTHASYVYNTVTDCYQRLEFLGDAILDYVITRHLYEDKQRHSPGELTDLRSALVNNNIFAYLAVKYEFYKYFKYLSPSLFTIIDNFVRNQKKRNDEFDLEEDVIIFNLI
jgi:dsRNA-specific ribonuclease